EHWKTIGESCQEVVPAMFFSLMVITVSFLPIFTMQAQEGRMFSPLAFTATYAMAASAILAITLVPVMMGYFLRGKIIDEHKNPINRALHAIHGSALKIAMQSRSITLLVALGLLAVTYYPYSKLGSEFMPPLDEGSFLYMPTTMVHASIGEAMDVLSKQDIALSNIPEVDSVVGKIGRAETPLDPAPVSMIETVINYKPEYISDRNGHRVKFRYSRKTKDFVRDEFGMLIPDSHGRPFRQWRDHIKTPDDIWQEIVKAAQIKGTTSAPKLQPIAARIVMLQSGMRAPMGVKVKGPDLETIEKVGLQIEKYLKEVPSVEPDAVVADRIVGKPYLEI
ncbi:hypothetical protein LCGC14_3157650, partial [marine sediment metagenome]